MSEITMADRLRTARRLVAAMKSAFYDSVPFQRVANVNAAEGALIANLSTLTSACETIERERDELRKILDWPRTHGVHYKIDTDTWHAATDDEYYHEGATFEDAVRSAIEATNALATEHDALEDVA